MSKVALRVYNREIEALTEQGNAEEAVAHCLHILKTFPKHLETYRLLGKAHLEGRHYNEAADIFTRVLLSVPDDFVAHLGLSIVRDEQKDMDAAIWHMERAFETNPSNAGVQAELRRLYGRRDGLEPPKIRLTRGALAHTYLKSGQYSQALVEARSVLAEDNSRTDMKMLMAMTFFRAGQKLEATEQCIELIKGYPYVLDANRILVEILPGTNMAGSIDTYKRRVQQLDPYAAFITGSIFDSANAQDAAVSMERLEWEPGVSVTGWKSTPAEQPVMPTSPQEAPQEAAAPAEDATANLPDWMKAAGWGSSSGEFQEGHVNYDEPEEPAATSELAAAEIPDWLKSMAPPGTGGLPTPPPEPEQKKEPAEPDLDWLAGLGAPTTSEQPSTETPTASNDDSAAWLAGLTAAAGASALTADSPEKKEETGAPDWLGEMPAMQPEAAPAAPDVDMDWLSGLGSLPEEPTPQPENKIEFDRPVTESPVPDWLSPPTEPVAAKQEDEDTAWLRGLAGDGSISFGEPAAESEASSLLSQDAEAPAASGNAEADLDWLSGLGLPDEQAADQTLTPGSLPSQEVETPTPGNADADLDWLSGLGLPGEQTKDEAPGLGKDEAQSDQWLESLSAGEPAVQEPLQPPTPTEPEKDDSAEWLAGLAAGTAGGLMASQPTPAPEPSRRLDPKKMHPDDVPPSELSAVIAGPGTNANEQDDAFKWLEMLAANQGAKAEELLTKPEERLDESPDWVGKVGKEPDVIAPTTAPVAAAPVAAEPPKPAEPAAPRFDAKKLHPDDVPPSELSAVIAGPGTNANEQDDAFKWLEMLAANQGAKAEELLTKPEERLDESPDWVGKVGKEPDVIAPTTAPVAAAPVTAEPAKPAEPAAPRFDAKKLHPDDVPPSELSAVIAGPGTNANEQDDAFKWLEMLAANQGAKAEELLTKPEERLDESPDWVGKVGKEPDVVASAEEQPHVEPVAAPPLAQEESQDWLSEVSTFEAPATAPVQESAVNWEAPAVESQPAQESEDWLAGLTAPMEESAAVSEPVAEQTIPQVEAEDWLSGLGAEAFGIEAGEPTSPEPAQQPQDAGFAEMTEEAQSEIPSWQAETQEAASPVEPLPWEMEKQVETEPVAAAEEPPTAISEPAISAEADISAWLQSLDTEETPRQSDDDIQAAVPPEQVAAAEEDIPAWVKGMEAPSSHQPSAATDEDLPDWLRDEVADTQPPTPQPVSQWVREEPIQAAPQPTPVASQPSKPQPVSQPVQPQSPTPSRLQQTGRLVGDPALAKARWQIEKGTLEAAMTEYNRLIKRGRMMEEVIFDLQEATYKHPVDVVVWQTLGDAYMRSNRLQDALDAYTKAEELLR